MFERNPEIPTRTRAFKNLLCAMYNKKYELEADACSYADDLLEMAVPGRPNGALPAVSRSLPTALHPDSTAKPRIEFRGCPRLLLVAATDLRLPKLFKDALIFTLGPWEEPEFVLLRRRAKNFQKCIPNFWMGRSSRSRRMHIANSAPKYSLSTKPSLPISRPWIRKSRFNTRTAGLNAASQTFAKRSMAMTSYVRRLSTVGCTMRSRKGMLRKLSENISRR